MLVHVLENLKGAGNGAPGVIQWGTWCHTMGQLVSYNGATGVIQCLGVHGYKLCACWNRLSTILV